MESKDVISTKFSCIIVAGGRGTRFGRKKQNVKWHGKALWRHVYDKCLQVSDDVIVVGYSKLGRQGAIYNGLQRVKYRRVVILEAARPAVTVEQIKRIGEDVHPSTSYAMESVDTIYYTMNIACSFHLNRKTTLQVQVPQAFDTQILKDAHKKFKGANSTSDSQLVEDCYHIKTHFIIGGRNLTKVTYPEDLKILDVICDEI